jgi:hypothetical protein
MPETDHVRANRRLRSETGIAFPLVQADAERLPFRDCGLVVEDLIEPRPGSGATSTYQDAEGLAWSRRWPAECIWRLRKP